MKNKLVCILSACFIAFSSILIPVYNVKALEVTAVAGLTGGAALLGLCALSGVGMAFENSKKASELTYEEKNRLENGLAKNYNDVALQNGIAQNKIDSWLKDVGTGVIDKTSECWGVFKDWVKNIELSESESRDLSTIPAGQLKLDDLLPFTCNFVGSGFNNETPVLNESDFGNLIGWTNEDFDSIMIYTLPKNYLGYARVWLYGFKKNNNGYEQFGTRILYNNSGFYNATSFNSSQINKDYIVIPDGANPTQIKFYTNNNLNCMINNNLVSEYGLENNIYFSTNTDYLEKLKGDDVIDVIDVTDIKNPIIETRPNSLVRVDWNKNTNRKPKNNNDDEEKNELVWADVFYSSLDDYLEEQQNAVVVYDNHIQENPEDKDKYFISTSPITNIYQEYNTLPVVNVPASGTIVNNNYTYNNYNNENVTIYNSEVYQDDLIPYVPSVGDFFQNKFPFCIPWDVFNFIKMFYAEKEAPTITIPFPYMSSQGVVTSDVVISLADYEYLSTISRVMFFSLFIVGLALMTRTQIKG